VPPPAELAGVDQLRSLFKHVARELAERGRAWNYISARLHLSALIIRLAYGRDGAILIFWRQRPFPPFDAEAFELVRPAYGRPIRHFYADGSATSFEKIRWPHFGSDAR
jgi:hypothetical protein